MSRARQRRLALARWRYRARHYHLVVQRCSWPGFPTDTREVDGHHPRYPHLRGWCFKAWQYRPSKMHDAPWWVTREQVDKEGPAPGDWYLYRFGDGGRTWARLTDEQFNDWQSWEVGP